MTFLEFFSSYHPKIKDNAIYLGKYVVDENVSIYVNKIDGPINEYTIVLNPLEDYPDDIITVATPYDVRNNSPLEFDKSKVKLNNTPLDSSLMCSSFFHHYSTKSSPLSYTRSLKECNCYYSNICRKRLNNIKWLTCKQYIDIEMLNWDRLFKRYLDTGLLKQLMDNNDMTMEKEHKDLILGK